MEAGNGGLVGLMTRATGPQGPAGPGPGPGRDPIVAASGCEPAPPSPQNPRP